MRDPATRRRPRTATSVSAALAIAIAALASAGCSTLATTAATATPALAGDWVLDAASSDNFDAKFIEVLKAQHERMHPRHGFGGMSGGRGGGMGPGSEYDPLMQAPDEPEKVRTRLAAGLRPPGKMHIALNVDTVEITADAEPARVFQPGQSVSRIDTSGAANVDSGWEQNAFVVRAKYTNRSSRSWRYEVEPSSGRLRLDFETDDPEFGSFKLTTRYRRAAGNSP
ncbi:MAG: hypothetical protein JSR15_04555 [Proteobacteria bacterium]|nr:hypothetical protein [Pseudomonadota bacterium]